MPSQSTMDLFADGAKGQKSRALFRAVILVLIAAAAVSSRLFSVIREFLPTWSPASVYACGVGIGKELES